MTVDPELKEKIRRDASTAAVLPASAQIIVAARGLLVAAAEPGGPDMLGEAVGERLATPEAGVEVGEDGDGAAGGGGVVAAADGAHSRRKADGAHLADACAAGPPPGADDLVAARVGMRPHDADLARVPDLALSASRQALADARVGRGGVDGTADEAGLAGPRCKARVAASAV
jgi:hypothetical protein